MTTEEFKRRFLPLSRRLYTVAWRMTGNQQDAEDIVQDCYIKLWNKRDALSHVINIEAYAVTLVKHLCYDAHNEKHGTTDTVLWDNETRGTENITEQKDVLAHVRKMIDNLPDQQKMVMTMREIDDCSYEEIEETTGLSAVNVRVLLSRARKSIREQFKELLKNENR